MGIRRDALMKRYKKRLGVLVVSSLFCLYAILVFMMFLQHCNSVTVVFGTNLSSLPRFLPFHPPRPLPRQASRH